MDRIYLASQSPRRRELLQQIDVRYDLLRLRNDPSRQVDVDESPLPAEPAAQYAERVCRDKAQTAYKVLLLRALPIAPVLAADTVVSLDGEIIGKPSDEVHAAEILRRLSGRTHEVITAVAVCLGERLECRVVTTRIRFAALDEARIQRYLASGEAYDKAGAYGIQGQAAAFVEHLEGSYSGVVGLPLFETAELLRAFGIPAP